MGPLDVDESCLSYGWKVKKSKVHVGMCRPFVETGLRDTADLVCLLLHWTVWLVESVRMTSISSHGAALLTITW